MSKARVGLIGSVLSLLLAACNGLVPIDAPTPIQAMPTTVVSQEIAQEYPLPPMNGALRFERLGLEEGLSQSAVHTILQDRFGFLWIGTEDGLNRYDGHTFSILRPDPDDPASISDRWITCIYEDSQGYLWIGTRLGGLNRYDHETGTFTYFMNDPADPNSLASNRVNTVLEDSRGYLWVGTNNGLDRLNRETGEFRHFRSDANILTSISSNNITALYEDSRGILWVGTGDGGLNRFNAAIFTFLSFKHNTRNPRSLSNNYVRAITEDSSGNLWVATHGGLNRLNYEHGIFTRYTHDNNNPTSLIDNYALSLHVDKSGTLWVGTDNGLERYQPETGSFVHYRHNNGDPTSLSNNTIMAVYEDQGGVLWVGTYGGGLNKYNRGQSKFTYYNNNPENPNSLSSDFIFPIFVDQYGIVWIGTYGGGLNRFNPATGLFTYYRHDPDDSGSLLDDEVTSVYMDRTGTLWVGTAMGLSRLNPNTREFIHYRHDQRNPDSLVGAPVYTIYEDRAGGLWFGTANGLDQFEPSTETFIHYRADSTRPRSLSSDFVTTVLEDRFRNLWVGTFDNGLNRFDTRNEGFIHYQHNPNQPQGLTHNSIMAIYQDSKNRLWIATAGGGLNLYERETDSFIHYTEKDGLPNNVVYGIVEDDAGYLWLSTNLGLSRFDPETENFRNYTASDGLQSNEFNMGAYARGPDGTLYFGGVNGLNIFDPANIKDSAYTPPVILTNLSQGGQPVPEQPQPELIRDITLTWPQNDLAFEFAALSYAQPARNQHAYMLENFDSDWNYIGTRRDGRYTNLPGGTYILRLKGSNSDGVWNETGQSIRITVVPPVWQTWAFRIIVAVFVIGLGLLVYRIRVRNIEAQNLQLEFLVRERTSALQKRTTEMEALYSGDEKIIRAMTLDQVFQAIVQVAVDKLHADRSVVFVWDEKQTRVVPRVSHGFAPGTLAVLTFSKGEGVVGRVLETGETVVVPELDLDTLRPDVRAAIVAEGIHSFVHLPIRVDEQIIGVFNIGFTRPEAITEDTVRLFTALVQRAALSIENMQLFEKTKELAVVEERNRVARDLHDSAKQKAFAALAQLGAVSGILKNNPSNAWTHLNEAENLVYEVIQELTFLIQEMYPMALKEKGLATTLREYVFEWENRNGVMINLTIQNSRRMNLEAEQAIYRMIQEALANVARHSQSDQVDVSLVYNAETVTVTVADNGLGFDSARKTGGMGLRIIEERAKSIGGEACIQSQPGRGTKVVITAPFNGHT